MKPSIVFVLSLMIFTLIVLTIVNWKITVCIFLILGIFGLLIGGGFLMELIANWLEKADRDFKNRKRQ